MIRVRRPRALALAGSAALACSLILTGCTASVGFPAEAATALGSVASTAEPTTPVPTMAPSPTGTPSPTAPGTPSPTAPASTAQPPAGPEPTQSAPEPTPEPTTAAPAPSPTPATDAAVAEAQRILQKFSIPVGPVDGVWGARTAQGLCAFRQIAGLEVSRQKLTDSDLAKLRDFDGAYSRLSSIPAARNGHGTFLLAQETCQVMLYAEGGVYVRAMRISSGRSGFETPNGDYWLGRTSPGWSCSTLYPDACHNHTAGENALHPDGRGELSQYGNMYNKRSFNGAIMLHGSGSVPLHPASHGCVRVSVANSDWMYHNLPNGPGAIPISVVGSYS